MSFPTGPLIAVILLAACGPVPLEQAERECLQDARLAVHPRGEIGFGVGSNGPSADLDLTISTDYLLGRDPSAVFDACVINKSGQRPSQPLYSRSDWKG